MIDSLIENTASDTKTKGHIITLQYDICKPISILLHWLMCAPQKKLNIKLKGRSFSLGENR